MKEKKKKEDVISCRGCLLTYPCLIWLLRAFESDRGAVAQCLERAIDNRVVAGSNPTESVGNFGNFQYPTLPVSFGRVF